MCHRFVRKTPVPKLLKRFKVKRLAPSVPEPSYNIAPADGIAIVNDEGERQLLPARWGLIPSWVKDPSPGNHLINARAETVAEKPTFRHALIKQRCLIIADGFYEWKRRERETFRSLSASARESLSPLPAFTRSGPPLQMRPCIPARSLPPRQMNVVKPFHDRMPVILPKADEDPGSIRFSRTRKISSAFSPPMMRMQWKHGKSRQR